MIFCSVRQKPPLGGFLLVVKTFFFMKPVLLIKYDTDSGRKFVTNIIKILF